MDDGFRRRRSIADCKCTSVEKLGCPGETVDRNLSRGPEKAIVDFIPDLRSNVQVINNAASANIVIAYEHREKSNLDESNGGSLVIECMYKAVSITREKKVHVSYDWKGLYIRVRLQTYL